MQNSHMKYHNFPHFLLRHGPGKIGFASITMKVWIQIVESFDDLDKFDDLDQQCMMKRFPNSTYNRIHH